MHVLPLDKNKYHDFEFWSHIVLTAIMKFCKIGMFSN